MILFPKCNVLVNGGLFHCVMDGMLNFLKNFKLHFPINVV